MSADNPPAGTPAEAARALAATRVELAAKLVDAASEPLATFDGPDGHTVSGFAVANRVAFDADALLAVFRKAVPRDAARRTK